MLTDILPKLFAGPIFFANRRRFAKFAKIRFSRKFSRLQYSMLLT
ncbi:MAG: hypothetical protein PV344_04735 [Anaplasma sp.]|nr:hypothetical protein [Anaplasma sp.]